MDMHKTAGGHIPLHECLKRFRAEAGLSFQQLSERSYVDVAYLHRIETGKALRPSRDILIRIAFGLGLDLETADELITAGGHLPLLRPITTVPRRTPNADSIGSPA